MYFVTFDLSLMLTKVQEANLELAKKPIAAEATLDDKEKLAAAQKAMAEAQQAVVKAQQSIAKAMFYNLNREFHANQKEVDTDAAFCQALIDYTLTMANAVGRDRAALANYLLNDGGMYQEICQIKRRKAVAKRSTLDRVLD